MHIFGIGADGVLHLADLADGFRPFGVGVNRRVSKHLRHFEIVFGE